MSDNYKQLELSVVASIYNSEKIIPVLVESLIFVLEKLCITYEVILIDDGSRDNSAFILERESKKNLKVKSIILSRNFGQQIAMTAGIHYASGKYVLIMDGDLQNPPESIPDLYNKIKEGFDIVYATSTVKNNFLDGVTSRVFWKVLKSIMKVDIPESQLMMRLMTSKVVNFYRMYPEKIRTVAAIVHDIGMNTAIIQVDNKRRHSGKSNYNIFKRLDLAVDVFLDFSSNPLKIIFNLGILIFFCNAIMASYFIFMYSQGKVLPGFTSMILAVMFFGSLILVSIGILARYVANIYAEVKRRPLFIVRRFINLTETKD